MSVLETFFLLASRTQILTSALMMYVTPTLRAPTLWDRIAADVTRDFQEMERNAMVRYFRI